MCKEVLDYLDLKPGMTVLDCTVGTGGHAQAILERIQPEGRLIGIDQDIDSLHLAEEKLGKFDGSYTLVRENFRNLKKILCDLKIAEVEAMLFDLGLSSIQLENAERGFSIRQEGPLDMRMDRRGKICAFDLVNYLAEEEISSILKNFGQERYHRRIARLIVKERRGLPIKTTTQLTQIVLKAIPYKRKGSRIHPATRTFQALRIAVNRELEALECALEDSIDYLTAYGRICVISFHSLEDRIVKNKFRRFSFSGQLRIITKGPLRPTQQEIINNPHCRSAKLRVAEKLIENRIGR